MWMYIQNGLHCYSDIGVFCWSAYDFSNNKNKNNPTSLRTTVKDSPRTVKFIKNNILKCRGYK